MLSLFDKQGRPSGKELIHWLTGDEKDSTHVHVLINHVEVKPYLKLVLQYMPFEFQ